MIAYVIIGVLTGAAYALFAMGFVVVYKGTRVFNLAHGEIGGAGVYVAWLSLEVLPAPLAALVGILAAAVLAMLIERLLMRRLVDRSPLAGLASTLGVALTLAYGEVHLFGANVKTFPSPVGDGSVKFGGTVVTAPRFAALVLAVGAALGITVLLHRTRAGLAMRAVTSDSTLARVSGVPVDVARSMAWAIGGALAAAAAILLAAVYTFHPISTTLLLVPALAAVLLGGLTSLPGALIGGIAIGVAESLVVWRVSTPGVVDLTVFALILAVLLFRPEGLLGET